MTASASTAETSRHTRFTYISFEVLQHNLYRFVVYKLLVEDGRSP